MYTVGITGGSGSGKTLFLSHLREHFTPGELCVVSQDDYYRPLETQHVDENGVENFDLPDAIDLEAFHNDVVRLKNGTTVQRKEYLFNRKEADARVLTFRPAPILVVEGLFVQYDRKLAAELDLTLFIEAKEYLKLSRRIRRDDKERGYDLDDVLYRYHHHVTPVYEGLIEPLKSEADMVIPNNGDFKRALEFVVWALRSRLTGVAN